MQADFSEWDIHKVVAQRLRYMRHVQLAWHTANGAHMHPATAKQMQRAGVVPGIPDFIILRRGHPPIGLELKSTTGKLSQAQKTVLAELDAQGWKTYVTYGMDEAMMALEEI